MFSMIQTIEHALQRSLDRRFDRKTRRLAVERFARLHPRWYASLFDETLLAQPAAAAALARRDAAALALAWSAQFGTRAAPHTDRLEEVRSVAADFLALLAAAEQDLGRPAASPVGFPQPTG